MEILSDVEAGSYKLLYVAPERFRSPRFLNTVGALKIELLAIDEAHCISRWGMTFDLIMAVLVLLSRN